MSDYDYGKKYYWLAVLVLPFVLAVALAFGQRSVADCLSVFDYFKFSPFATLFTSAFETVGWSVPSVAVNAVSWMMMVFLAHLCMDFVLFLPTLCYKAFGLERFGEHNEK